MRILSYLRELSDALEDWDNLDEVYGVLQNDLGTLKDFTENVRELQQDGS